MRKFILNHLLNTWCVWNRTLLYITNEQKYFSIARPQSCRKCQVFLNETWNKSSKLYLIIYLVTTLTMKQLFFYNNIIIFTNLLFIIKQFIMSHQYIMATSSNIHALGFSNDFDNAISLLPFQNVLGFLENFYWSIINSPSLSSQPSSKKKMQRKQFC